MISSTTTSCWPTSLHEYDWLHLHHEDFTGQYGKFWAGQHQMAWYQEDVRTNEAMAAKHGYKKVSQLKLAVAKKIRDFVAGGGYLFAMCSATDTMILRLPPKARTSARCHLTATRWRRMRSSG